MNESDSGYMAQALGCMADSTPTLRDQFAIAVLPWALENAPPSGLIREDSDAAVRAYRIADAMMEARNAQQ